MPNMMDVGHNQNDSNNLTSHVIELATSGRQVHYLKGTFGQGSVVPVIALHGLGGSSAYWLSCIKAAALEHSRTVLALDWDGHGQTAFSGRDDLSMEDLVSDLLDFLQTLGIQKVILLAHSMSAMVSTIFAERFPERVVLLISLNPVRNLSRAVRDGLLQRVALARKGTEGMATIAEAIATSAVSVYTGSSNPAAVQRIREMVRNTGARAYAAAAIALQQSETLDVSTVTCSTVLIGGQEDYLASSNLVRAWAAELPPESTDVHILEDVGHWAAVEAPARVGKLLRIVLDHRPFFLMVAAFRSPEIFTLSFCPLTSETALLAVNDAGCGHSWLDLSGNKSTLYATDWSTPPSISSFRIIPPSLAMPFPTIARRAQAPSDHLSGYVCSNDKAVYSACGPQVDVFLLDRKLQSLQSRKAAQSLSLVGKSGVRACNGEGDFGGLRHGGHSADLSPDGTRLYVADIGRNCIWLYEVDPESGLLTLLSQNIAKRLNDGPRHVWPHPNGRIVYSLQEHSSYVAVLALSGDGRTLEWMQGVDILPKGTPCDKFWADGMVRLSPNCDTLFASTRGLQADTKGYVAAWPLLASGHLSSVACEHPHRFQTLTSGGWANAIAICPEYGPHGETFLTLTDSEEGFVQILSHDRVSGFKVLSHTPLSISALRIQASVAVWL